MKVYVITKGIYSDYHICGVALDKERANRLALLFSSKYEKAEVEEYDTECIVERPDGTCMWRVIFTELLGMMEVEAEIMTSLIGSDAEHVVYKSPKDMKVYVWAKDEKSAIKIASERRAMYLAELQGI